MKPASIPANTARAHTRHRLALFSLVIIALVAVGWHSSPASGAGERVPAMYLPLLDHDTDIDATATATADTAADATATATITPGNTATAMATTATATAIATATATGTPSLPIDVIGTVYLRPVYAQHILVEPQPVAYAVVLDTSSSMNLNFNGEALDTDGFTKLQCNAQSDPVRYAKFQHDIARCQEIGATWLPKSERRIAVAKAALSRLIVQMAPFDIMQIVGFSGATTDWIYGTAAGKQQLNDILQSIGATNGDPSTTNGGSSTATSLKTVRERLLSAPATSVNGHTFKPAVILLTGSVPSYFVNSSNPGTGFGWYNDAHDNPPCAQLIGRDYVSMCQVGLTNTNPSIERPITAVASEAQVIKTMNDGNIVIFVISVTGETTIGLATDVASQPTYPYYSELSQWSSEDSLIRGINSAIREAECVPSSGLHWLNNIDSAHTVSDPAERVRLGLPADTSVYGYAYLYAANGQSLQTVPVRKDAQTGKLSYTFPQVAEGVYTLQAFVGYRGDDQPTPIARDYNWILFPSLLHDTSRTFSLAQSRTGGTTVALDPLYLDLNGFACD